MSYRQVSYHKTSCFVFYPRSNLRQKHTSIQFSTTRSPRRPIDAQWAPQKQTARSHPPSASSALDDVSPSVKLSAVAEALARRRDYPGALRILQEMSTTGVSLDTHTLCAIVDATVSSPSSLAKILSHLPPPGFASSSVEQISCHPAAAPFDPSRATDLSLGMSFLVVVGGAIAVEVVEPAIWHHSANEATSILIMVMAALIYDRYGGGRGNVWNSVVKGLGRLFVDDPVRKVRVDAAHFLLAYLLGVPWICFRPNPAQLIREYGARGISEVDLDRYLVWSLAGVAVEDHLDGRLIESSLSGARTLLKKIGARPRGSAEEQINMAVAQAKELLRIHEKTYSVVVACMLNGGSVGDCLSAIANQFSKGSSQ